MSIDREVNARVDAFGSNLQALKDRYSMTRELVDLIALQRIKKGMDDQRNSIAMMMNTNPATIKQQREQEIFGRTAQDVAQQVGGVLQTAQNQKQMAQRRPAPQGLGALMPQQGQRPQQPQTRMMQAGGIVAFQEGNLVKPPRTQEEQIQYLVDQGFSDEQIKEEVKKLGLLPQAADRIIQQLRNKERATAPAGPMEEVPVTASRLPLATDPPGMMEEVVVTGQREPSPLSAEGMMREQAKTKQTKDKNITQIPVPKDITPSTLSKVMEGLGAIGEGFGERTGESIAQAKKTREGIRETLTPESVLEAQRTGKYRYRTSPQTETPQTKPPTQDQTEGIAAIAGQPKGVPSDTPLIFRGQQNVPAGTGSAPSGGGTPSAPDPIPEGYNLQKGLETVGDAPKPVMVDRTGLEKRGVDFTKAYGVDPASIDPEARGVAALQKAEDYYGVKDKDAELRKGLADLAALDAAQTDPDKLRRNRLKAFLLGGAGRGSSTLAGAGAASMNLGRAQERDIRSRQIKRNEMLRTIQDKDTEIRKLAKGEEKAAMERADNLKMEGLRIISTMSNAELSARQTEANAINQSNIAGYQQKIQRVELLMEDAQSKIDNAIERAKLESMDASRRGQIANAGIDDAMRRMTAVDKILSEVYQDQVETDAILRRLNMELAAAENNDDIQKYKDQIKNRQKEIKGSLAISHGNLYDEMDSLNSKILSLESMRNSALGAPSSNVAVSSQDQSLIDKYMP